MSAAVPSCPVGTSVFPLSFLSLPRYEVQITDGGAGDLDTAIDGACNLALTACLGAPACVPTSVDEVRVGVRGKPSDLTPRELTQAMLDAFARAPGTEPGGARSILFLDEEPAPEICGQIRFRLLASTRSSKSLVVRMSARVGRARTAVRVRLRCLPSDPSAASAPVCVGPGGTPCPVEPGAPTMPAPPTLPDPPGPPTITTTTTTLEPRPVATTSTTTTSEPTSTTGQPSLPTRPTTTTTRPPASAPRPPTSSGRSVYVSPAGNDAAAGTTRTTPLKTFARALGRLRPGDSLVLLDGTYTRATTGLPRIDCGGGGNAVSGTASAPITIRAEHERRAFLSSDGEQAGFEMVSCSWWRVEGLRAGSRDERNAAQDAGFPFRFRAVSHVTLHRLLGSHNNRAHNTHVFSVEESSHVLLEECEATFYHRHGFSIWRSWDVTVRRSYANSMRYGEQGCCSEIDNAPYGDVAFVFYGTSASTIENSVSDAGNGFNISGIFNSLDPSDSGGRNNRILGSVSLDDDSGILINSRTVDGNYHNASDNLIRDFVAVRTWGHELYLRGTANNVIENVTLYGSSQNSGLVVDGGDDGVGGTCGPPNDEGCGFTARHVLSVDHELGHGFTAEEQENWRIEHSNAAGSEHNWVVGEPVGDATGHVQRSTSTDPGAIGLGAGECIMWIPESSPMKRAGKDGRDIGANIVYRYENGGLTGTPLWHRETGAFPCGAVVAGINDGPRSCSNLHTRLNVNTNGCRLPLPTPP